MLACAAPPPPAPPPPAAPSLRLPIACALGVDCWISSRPDGDPGEAAFDHTGGSHTYPGHDGSDLAVAHVGQAVATHVVAPIDAVVARTRDEVPDGQLLADGREAVEGQECGNAVVLDPGGGWEIQLCHLLHGTVRVAPGARVSAGEPLGRVGWSGLADHPHVHLTVRRDGRAVDPFDGRFLDDGAPASVGPLWATPMPDAREVDALVWAGFDVGPRDRDDTSWADRRAARRPAGLRGLARVRGVPVPSGGGRPRRDLDRAPGGEVRHRAFTQPRDRPPETLWIEEAWPDGERPTGLWTARVAWERGRTRELWASAVLR